MLRAIIIGTGQIGKTHAEAMIKSSNLELSGFMGNNFKNTKDIAEIYGVQAFENFETLDNQCIDMAIVCTPSYIRKEIIYKLIDKKINILCEKPFALSYEEGKLMEEYAKAKGVKIMVGHVLRFWPSYVKIKEVIEEGRLGDIIHIYSNRLSKYPDWTSWHKDPNKSGGGLYDLAIHDLDYLVHLFGEVESVDAIGRKDETGCYNFTVSNLKFINGKQGTVESNMDIKGNYPFTTFVRVVGTQGTLEYESSKKLNKDNSMENYESFIEYIEGYSPKKIEVIKYNPYQKQMDYFANCIEEGRETEIIKMEEVLHVLRLLDKIKTSIEEEKRIKMSPKICSGMANYVIEK